MAPRTISAFLVAVIAVVIIAVLSYTSLQNRASSAQSLTDTIEVMAQLQSVLSTLKDAETGQRGYLLTDRDTYLEPFSAARGQLSGELAALHKVIESNPAQLKRFDTLQALAAEKMEELGETVKLKQEGHAQEALTIVLTDRGKNTMDGIRAAVAEMVSAERQTIAAQTVDWQNAQRFPSASPGAAPRFCCF